MYEKIRHQGSFRPHYFFMKRQKYGLKPKNKDLRIPSKVPLVYLTIPDFISQGPRPWALPIPEAG